jgi:hypothetical protein
VPAAPTTINEIDRKLRDILLAADPSKYPSMLSLARALSDRRLDSFSYMRRGTQEFTGPFSIAPYISYARQINLLDADLKNVPPKADIRSLENFQHYLDQEVDVYLAEHNCSHNDIQTAVQSLLINSIPRIPTLRRIHGASKNPPDFRFFQISMKIRSIFRPGVLRIISRQLIVVPAVFEE